MTGPSRIAARFAKLKADNRSGFVAYVMAGDPDLEATWRMLDGLPGAGADIVELGFPFTDPTADGVSIQKAGRRALDAGTTLTKTLKLAARFRAAHPDTPLILMGYANPIYRRGWAMFAAEAEEAGVDGVIVVDLPPEEDAPLRTAHKRFKSHGSNCRKRNGFYLLRIRDRGHGRSGGGGSRRRGRACASACEVRSADRGRVRGAHAGAGAIGRASRRRRRGRVGHRRRSGRGWSGSGADADPYACRRRAPRAIGIDRRSPRRTKKAAVEQELMNELA